MIRAMRTLAKAVIGGLVLSKKMRLMSVNFATNQDQYPVNTSNGRAG
jgi:hypothetical protein